MSLGRIALGGMLLAALVSFGGRVASAQPMPSALKEVWFTNTLAAGRTEWGAREPSRLGDGLARSFREGPPRDLTNRVQ
jgi:hypothetical protein